MWNRSTISLGRDERVVAFAAGGEQVGEECLQDGEALGHDRAGGSLPRCVDARDRSGRGELRRRFLVSFADGAQCVGHFPSELVGLDRDRPPVLAQDPGSELRQRRVAGDEDAVLQLSGVAECALDPPRGVARELDPRLADDVADLPRRPAAVLVDVELRRNPEVAFATCREADVTPDPRNAERADVLAVEILADHVPAAVVGEEAVGIDACVRSAGCGRSSSTGT